MMMSSLNKAHPEAVYGIDFGHLYHYLNGIALALLYWVLFRSWLPGNWLVRGFLWGVIVFLMADVIVAPLAAGVGIFFTNTPQPLAMTISSFVAHIAYGVALTFSLAASSVDGAGEPAQAGSTRERP